MSRKFRVGNDIPINWSLVNEDGSPYIVEGKNFAIELLIGNSKRVRIGGATANENTISFEYLGKDQGPLGSVNLIYIENNGKIDMVTFDTEDAFTMVPHSWLAVDEDETPETITFDVVTVISEGIVIGSPHAVKYTPQTLTPEQQAQARTNIGAYTKPETGIPATDLAEPVQQELAKAETAYQKPETGIPAADMAQPVQDKLGKADTAYQKPNGGIPKTDLEAGAQTSLGKADTAVQPAALTPITSLIPEQATPENKLADKNFVNSSVATNTANYISDNGEPFQSVADLEAYAGPLTNNDYAFVVGTDSAGNTTYTRYKYNATTQTWAEEYVLNNSSFTAEQWAAISSGITALLVQKLTDLPTEIVTYVAQALTEAQKQQARQNIGATAPEIFWATYGTTTYAEVGAAVSAGKVVFCKYTYSSCVFRLDNTSYQGGQYIFTAINPFGELEYIRLSGDNRWHYEHTYLEDNSNKVQTLEGNESDQTKYPSVKAVFDYVAEATDEEIDDMMQEVLN